MSHKQKRTYAELHKIAGAFNRDKGYCALIAVCIATNASMGKVKRHMETKVTTGRRREHGKGTPLDVIEKTTMRFGKKYDIDFMDAGYIGQTLNRVHRDLQHSFPNDTFYCLVNGHIACIREGILEDWTVMSPSRRKVLKVWKIEERV